MGKEKRKHSDQSGYVLVTITAIVLYKPLQLLYTTLFLQSAEAASETSSYSDDET